MALRTIRNNATGQTMQVDDSQLANYGIGATPTPTAQPIQQAPTPQVTSQPEQQVRRSLLENVGSGLIGLGGSVYNPIADLYNKAISTTAGNAKIKGNMGATIANAGQGTAQTILSPEAARVAAETGSFAVPFGKAGMIGSKYVLPGIVSGGLNEAAQSNATPSSVVGGAALGGVIPGAAQGVGKILPKITTGIAERLMNSVYKEPLKDTRAAIKGGQTLGQEALKRGGAIGTPEGIYNKAVQQINDTENALQDQLMGSKGRVNFDKVEKDLTPYLDTLKQSGNPAYQAITDRINLLRQSNGGSIPDAQANQIKRSLYDEVRPSYGQQAVPGAEGIKAIAKSIKEQIAGNNTGVDQLNKDLSFYGRQADAMVDKSARGGRNDILGLKKAVTTAGAIAAAIPTHGASLALPAADMILGSNTGKTAIATGLNATGNAINKIATLTAPAAPLAAGIGARLPSIVSGQQNQQELQNNNTDNNHTITPPLPEINGNSTTTIGQSQAQSQNPLAGYMVDGKPISQSDAALIKGIADYKLDPSKVTSLRGGDRERIIGLVQQYDPSYDQTQYGAKGALRKDMESGKSAQNIRSLNTAIGHLSSLSQAGQGLGNTSLPIINTVKNAASSATGQPQTTKFNNAVNAVAGEMATVFKGTSGTDQEIQSWKDQMNSSQSPEQIQAGINQMIELMSSRLGAINSQYESGMGKPKDFKFLNSKSEKILRDLGIDTNTIDPTAN